MDLKYTTVVLFCLVKMSCGDPGDPVMFLPPLELRTVDNKPMMFSLANSQFQPVDQEFQSTSELQPSQQFQFGGNQFQPSQPAAAPVHHRRVHHKTTQPMPQTTPPPPPPPQPTPELPSEHRKHNFTFNEFVDALNQLSDNEEEVSDHSRAAARDDYGPRPYPPYPSSYSGSPGYSPNPRPYGYYPPKPSLYGPPAYQEPSYAPPPPPPPPPVHHHIVKTKSDVIDVIKPVTTKAAGKISGLISLVLALLTGSSPNDVELNGFKDIVINGIVKPLLVAKGGIKSLISKLVIPVISLLLINLEVLVTIWWLWEDCPEQQPPAYSYPKPSYNYNSYR